MRLPKRPRQHVSADRALVEVRRALPSEWIIREQAADYGIDLEIELATSEVSGCIFKAQVKGHEKIRWTKRGSFRQPVDAKTIRYWRHLPVPVVLFVVDLASPGVYWAPIPLLGAQSGPRAITVRCEHEIGDSCTDLRLFLLTWIDRKTAQHLLYGLPRIDRQLQERISRCGMDDFMFAQDDEVEDLRELYQAVLVLARTLGINTVGIIPWELWLARSELIHGNAEALAYGVHDEVVAYLTAFYQHSRDRAVSHLHGEDWTIHNAAAKSFAARRMDKRGMVVRFDNPLRDLPAHVWEGLENDLEKVGALRYRVRQPLT